MPRKCQFENCKKHPVFNYENEKTALYCMTHRLENMVDIKNKRCIFENCTKHPVFNYENEKTTLYCMTHRLENMVDIKNKRCIFENCTKHPVFNYENEKTTLYCQAHRLENMVDIKSKRCVFENCKKHPNFNYENEKTALYCQAHRLENMVDIKSKRCVFENCTKQPSFNYENEKMALYCQAHRLENMVDIKSKRCVFENCKKTPSFNYENKKTALYCMSHRLENMINIISPTCKTHLCPTRVGKKYNGYCIYCFVNLFPDVPVSRNYKTKEQAVVDFILQKYPDLSWIADKKIADGCSKRRPDLMLDLGYQNLIIEIDENQHIAYDCSCENKRTMELSQDLNHRPIIFIRFNPDEYKQGEVTVSSCFGVNSHGICVVKKSKTIEWTNRLLALSNVIDYWLNSENVTRKTVEIIQLFYDC